MNTESPALSYFLNENQWGEKFIDEINRQDFLTMNSTEFFDGYMDVNFWKDNTLYLVIGSDSGLLIPYILKKRLGRGSRICIIEPDAIHSIVEREQRRRIKRQEENKKIGSELSLHAHSRWQEDLLNGADQSWLLSGEIELVQSRAATADYTHIYAPIFTESSAAIAERHYALTSNFCRYVFVEKQFMNAADNHYPLKASDDFGLNKVAVVMGGSPSLDQHLDWILRHREQLFLIAVSRISTKLCDLNIKPDMVVSVDPYDFSYEVSKRGILWTDVPLIYNYHAAPQLIQEWQGPRLYVGKHLPWHADDLPQYENCVGLSGPTVSHSAVIVAAQLGFSTVALSGVDLCYDSDVSTHSKGSPEAMIQKLPSLCDAQVETYTGRIAGTSVTLLHAAEALENIGKGVNADKDIIFNLSPNAAKCASIKLMTIAEVPLPEVKPDFHDLFSQYEKIDTRAHLHNLRKEITLARQAFRKIRKHCKEAVVCVQNMYGVNAGSKAAQYSQKLTKLDKRLEKDFPVYMKTIKATNGMEFAQVIKPMKFEDMTDPELERWGTQYYDVISNSASRMIRQLNRLDERIDLRLYEASSDVKLTELIDRWKHDNTPGRVLQLAHQQSFSEDDQKQLQHAIDEFRRSTLEDHEIVESTLAKYNESIGNCMKSLLFLFNNQSVSDLTKLAENLQSEQWPYCALFQFTMGMVDQLEEQHESSINHFQNVIDLCSERLECSEDSIMSMQILIEESLVRMTSAFISSNDHDSAISTLGTLCEMLPQYVVSYAKLLQLCDQEEFALELLQNYTGHYPGNKRAAFALEQLFKSTSKTDVAVRSPKYGQSIKNAMQAILGVKPDDINKVA